MFASRRRSPALVLAALVLHAPLTAQTPPNVVLLVADDLGWADVGWHAEEIRTPHLDALRAESAELVFHYVQPQCTPSRVALLTGRYPSRFNDHCVQASNERALPRGTPTVGSLLRDRGYATCITGKWHLGSRPEDGPRYYGFDHSYGSLAGAVGMYDHRYRLDTPFARTWHRNGEYLDEVGHVTDLVTDEAIAWLGARAADERFFLYVAFHAVHTPLVEPQEWIKANAHVADADRRLLAAAVSHLDAAIGRILEALDEQGLADDTLVLFTSDNGGLERHPGGHYPPPDSRLDVVSSNAPLRGFKLDLFEGGIRVPTLCRWPGRIAPGVRTQVVHAVDWLPTLFRLTGDAVEGLELDGRDVSPWLLDPDRERVPRRLYWKWRQRLALRDGDYKLVRNAGRGPFLLFDVANDPSETRDLAESRPEVCDRLLELLRAEVARDAVPLAFDAR